MTWLSDSGIREKAKCQVPQKFIVDPGSSGIKRAEGNTVSVLVDPLPDTQWPYIGKKLQFRKATLHCFASKAEISFCGNQSTTRMYIQ